MKIKKSKIFLSAAFLFAFSFLSNFLLGCNLAFFLANQENENSLVLSSTNVNLSNAVSYKTSFALSATLVSSSDATVNWFTSDSSILSLSSSSGKEITVTALNEGNANVIAVSSDGLLSATCSVSVSLAELSCHEISDFAFVSSTSDSVSFTWTASVDSSQVRIDCYSTAEPTVLQSSSYFLNQNQVGTVENLFQDTSYTFTAYACNNGKTSKEKLSEKSSSLTAKTQVDVTAPSSVSNIKAKVSEHTIVLTWKNPSEQDLSYINISTNQTDMKGNAISALQVASTVTSARFENLSDNTEYTFTFVSEDKFGNVQGDSNNTSNLGETFTVSTSQDLTPPSCVSDIDFVIEVSKMTISWSEDDAALSSDFAYVLVKVGDGDEQKISAGEKTYSCTISNGTNYQVTICTQDISGNKSAEFSKDISTDFAELGISSVTAEAQYTGQLKVTWDSSSSDSSYVIYAVNQDDKTDFAYSSSFSGTTGVINNLTVGKTYSVNVCSVQESENYRILYKDDSATSSAQVKKLVWSILQPWGSQIMVPQISSTASYANVIITSSQDSYLYPVWIVEPALNGSSDAFSLQAANSSYEESGLYLYFGSNASGSTNYNSGNNTWGYSTSSHAHLSWSASAETIGTDTDFACFTLASVYVTENDTVDGYSSWYNINLVGDTSAYLYSNNYNVSADTGLTSDNAYDMSFAYKETILTE